MEVAGGARTYGKKCSMFDSCTINDMCVNIYILN